MAENSEQEDELILNLLSAHNPAATTLLYRVHFKAIYNFTFKLVGDAERAKDICQELFIAIWERRQQLKISKPIRRYLLSAALNRILNHQRDYARKITSLAEALHRSSITQQPSQPDVAVQARELENIIKKAIDVLPDPARATFIMSRSLGMTYREIALHFGVSEKAVEKNMSKALGLLRILLSKYL